jgi:hypothetical protein
MEQEVCSAYLPSPWCNLWGLDIVDLGRGKSGKSGKSGKRRHAFNVYVP